MNAATRAFNSWRSFPALARAADEIAWPVASLLVWDKQSIGPGWRGLRPRYEVVALLAHRRFAIGDRTLTEQRWCELAATRLEATVREVTQ